MLTEFSAETTNLPDHFPVMVIMQRRPAQVSRWVDYVWTAVGVTVGNAQPPAGETTVTYLDDDIQLHVFSGYQVRLNIDECESYYRNLMSPTPHCFVVVHQDDDNDDQPLPFIVGLSFDEAHAYLEGDDTVFTVDMPPELYRWTEAFVLAHYCPEQRKKRKRKDWRGQKTEH